MITHSEQREFCCNQTTNMVGSKQGDCKEHSQSGGNGRIPVFARIVMVGTPCGRAQTGDDGNFLTPDRCELRADEVRHPDGEIHHQVLSTQIDVG